MEPAVFIDTNLFFYAQDDRFPVKRAKARAWLYFLAETGYGIANLQVINEFTNSVLKRMPALENAQVFAMADDIRLFGDSPIDWDDVAFARKLRARTAFSWWDCLLLASAIELGCSHFLSEDLQDGHQLGDLTVMNPFLHRPEELFGPLGD